MAALPELTLPPAPPMAISNNPNQFKLLVVKAGLQQYTEKVPGLPKIHKETVSKTIIFFLFLLLFT